MTGAPEAASLDGSGGTMEAKISGGTFVTWQGMGDEKLLFLQLPTPFANYMAEPWGGILIVTARPDHSDPEIMETADLRRDLAQLSAKTEGRHVFWKSEKDANEREKIKKRLGKSPRYIG
jgi:hypothetical protein